MEIIVLLHFRLKSPVMVGDKKCIDLQFYTEVCSQFEDINDRKGGGRRMTEQDEVILEKRELE